MLIVKDVEELSKELINSLGGSSKREWNAVGGVAGKELVKRSWAVKEVWIYNSTDETYIPLLAFGLYSSSFVGLPEFWVLLTSSFLSKARYQLAVARRAKAFLDSYPPFVVTFHRWQERRMRFARVFGLREQKRNKTLVFFGR